MANKMWYCDNVNLPYHADWQYIDLEEPFPSLIWCCDGEKVYKTDWLHTKISSPYPDKMWLCNNINLPYKQGWQYAGFDTTLHFPTVRYETEFKPKISYKIETTGVVKDIISRVFDDQNKVIAYQGLNKQLTIVSTENTTTIWFDKLLSFNNSEIKINLGQFCHNEQNQIQLFLSDSIPNDWDLDYFYGQQLCVPNTELTFVISENFTRYMGIGFAHATVGIKSIYVDSVKVV